MSLPDFQFLTAQQIDSVLKKNATDFTSLALQEGFAIALEAVIAAVVTAGNPVNSVGVLTALVTALSTLVGEADDKVSLVLDIIQFCKMVEKDINDKIQFALDELKYSRDEDPDSLIFDDLRWNKIIGRALNYNSTSETQVVKELSDGSFDFRYLLGYKPDGVHQRYLSQELQYLLNCKMEAY